jgi:hypothetical protein
MVFDRFATLVVRSAVVVLLTAPTASPAQGRRHADSLTDREFWRIFTTMSEESGNFPSENFVSNEKTFQFVIPTLQRTLTPHGVYLGVGPEQNFTYIANLEPRLAVIFDIRRQNAMLHLMYKALFELSASRADFVSRLFSRPLPASLGSASTAGEIFAQAATAPPSDSAFRANWAAIINRLTVVHGFAIADTDRASIQHVYSAFFEAGPDISYAYRLGSRPSVTPWFVSFAQLQTVTNADSVNMAFISSEARYQVVRTMQQRNLIVPVVGDFGGPKAIRSVAEYLTERGATVTAFYTSNVEQYLFGGFGADQRFYRNVSTLPIDSTSMFIRSLPSNPPPTPILSPGPAIFSIRINDSTGARTNRTMVLDTSVMNVLLRSRATLSTTAAFTSGIASIRATLDAFNAGSFGTYSQVIATTKTDGWTVPR